MRSASRTGFCGCLPNSCGLRRSKSGSRRKNFKQVQLSQVLERVGEAYRAVAEDEGKSFATSIEPDIQIVGDQDLLAQMFANLVENSIRHTPPTPSSVSS